MTNAEIRDWYVSQVRAIRDLDGEWEAVGLTIRERAKKAWRIRADLRIEARDRMTDQIARDRLRARDLAKYGSEDGPEFEWLMDRARKGGLTLEAAYRSILDSSMRTNEEVDHRFGMEGGRSTGR